MCFLFQHFDRSCPGGEKLNDDLRILEHRFGQDFIELEINFPAGDAYPANPFMVRVVSPRCKWYTGMVVFFDRHYVSNLKYYLAHNEWFGMWAGLRPCYSWRDCLFGDLNYWNRPGMLATRIDSRKYLGGRPIQLHSL
jgi:hypothetical protein